MVLQWCDRCQSSKAWKRIRCMSSALISGGISMSRMRTDSICSSGRMSRGMVTGRTLSARCGFPIMAPESPRAMIGGFDIGMIQIRNSLSMFTFRKSSSIIRLKRSGMIWTVGVRLNKRTLGIAHLQS